MGHRLIAEDRLAKRRRFENRVNLSEFEIRPSERKFLIPLNRLLVVVAAGLDVPLGSIKTAELVIDGDSFDLRSLSQPGRLTLTTEDKE